MTKSSLIIDLRRQLPWHKRYVSHTTTAMLWAGWIFLWRPLMIVVGFIGVQNPYLFNHFIEVFTKALENGFTAGSGVVDEPIKDEKGEYWPKNLSTYDGPTILRNLVIKSSKL